MNKAYFQTAFYFATVLLGQGSSFLLLPIVTRFVTKEVFGEYSLILVVAGFTAMIGSVWIRNLGFRLYYEAVQEKRTRSYFLTLVVLQAAIIVIGLGVLSLFRNSILNEPISLSLFWVMGAYVLLGDYYSLSVDLVRAEDKTIHFSLAEVLNALIRFGVTIAMLMWGFRTAEALVFAIVVALLLPSVYATVILAKQLTGPARLDFSAIRGLIRYGPSSLALPISSWAEENADRIVLDRLSGASVVGIYSAAYSLADRVVGAIEQAVFKMAWPNMLRAWTEKGPEAARAAIKQGFKMHLWLSTGPVVFIAVYNEEFVTLLGKNFQEGAVIMPFIVASAWLRGTRTYLDRHLEIKKRFGIKAGITAIGATINIVLNLILIPRYGLAGAGAATLIDFLVTWIISFAIRDRELIEVPYGAFLGALGLAGFAWLNSSVFIPEAYKLVSFIIIYALGFAYVAFGARLLNRFKANRA